MNVMSFKVSFQYGTINNSRNLTSRQHHLPVVPQKGDRISVRRLPGSRHEQAGTVTDVIWYLYDEEPTSSEVVVLVALD